MTNRSWIAILALLLGLGACDRAERDTAPAVAATDPAAEQVGGELSEVALAADWDARLDATMLEQGRRDAAWSRVVQLDTAGLGGPAGAFPESFDDITLEAVNSRAMHLPLHGDISGPSVLRTQILLDRALFSPGIIDGYWGKNTEKALYWFQHREGLRRTGRLDQETFDRLSQAAGGSDELIRRHQLTAEDVEGPFVSIPDDIYEKAKLDCLCYESLTEKLAELFHTSPNVLAQLNPGVNLDAVSAGTALQVPAVRAADAGRGLQVARLVVSGEGFYLHALDANDRILYHFPSTLGSSFDPSPDGSHRVTRITRDPWWHYQPAILAHVPDDEPDAKIPPGPNNAVGLVWMSLSIPHYGIHGTSAPETIGYSTSAGCVRLTNWDALFLSERISEGTTVEFQETRPGEGS
jgi:lipoprotein-anchoring transpeptidase ErfK/SrfK